MNTSKFSKVLNFIKIGLLILLAVLFITKAFGSLSWRMSHDTPLLHYVAFLMDKYDLVPYRDIFETSMPGTFAFHYVIVKLFGYSDIAFRYIDLSLLIVLLSFTYAFMKRFGHIVGATSAISFGLIYLSKGQSMGLQKDYVGLIPIALTLICIPTSYEKHIKLIRFAAIGLLFGISTLIKPHLAIGFPIVFCTLIALNYKSQNNSIFEFTKIVLTSILSFMIPIILSCIWLASHSALTPFLDIFLNYLPLHASITGWHETIFGYNRIEYLITYTLMFGGYGLLLLSSIVAYYHIGKNIKTNKAAFISLICLATCTLAYSIYPTLAGKFWNYHYMPFAYFCALSIGLCMFKFSSLCTSTEKELDPSIKINIRKEAFLVVIFILVMAVQLPLPHFISTTLFDIKSNSKNQVYAPMGGRTDEIADWLKARLKKGDTVQALDWTGGSIQGMLIAKAKLATKFLYDYHFYHHVSLPYIKGLRQSFINQITETMPRFIIEVETFKPWITGKDTTRVFSELKTFMANNYKIAFKGYGYIIYEINGK